MKRTNSTAVTKFVYSFAKSFQFICHLNNSINMYNVSLDNISKTAGQILLRNVHTHHNTATSLTMVQQTKRSIADDGSTVMHMNN